MILVSSHVRMCRREPFIVIRYYHSSVPFISESLLSKSYCNVLVTVHVWNGIIYLPASYKNCYQISLKYSCYHDADDKNDYIAFRHEVLIWNRFNELAEDTKHLLQRVVNVVTRIPAQRKSESMLPTGLFWKPMINSGCTMQYFSSHGTNFNDVHLEKMFVDRFYWESIVLAGYSSLWTEHNVSCKRQVCKAEPDLCWRRIHYRSLVMSSYSTKASQIKLIAVCY